MKIKIDDFVIDYWHKEISDLKLQNEELRKSIERLKPDLARDKREEAGESFCSKLDGRTMREILFRGKSGDDGEWVYGEIHSYFPDYPGSEIFCFIGAFGVETETIGQYTGVDDRRGRKIFEGDVVSAENDEFQFDGVVKYHRGAFVIYPFKDESWKLVYSLLDDGCEFVINGNIYDNPEWLEDSVDEKETISKKERYKEGLR